MERELIEKDLDEFVEGDTWPALQDDGEPTPLPDPTAVSGVLRRLKRFADEIRMVSDVADTDIARIKAWHADRVEGITKQVAHGERSLENFMRVFHMATKKKSLALAEGTLKLSEARSRVELDPQDPAFMDWVIGDAEAATEWRATGILRVALAHPECVRVNIAPDKKALGMLDHELAETRGGVKSEVLVTKSGEMVPGVSVNKDEELQFRVTLGDE